MTNAVLVIAGNDPSGGAGLQADNESLAALGCRALPVISCVTIQDTRNVYRTQTLSGDWVEQQIRTIIADIPVNVCKIGLLGSCEVIQAVAAVLRDHPHIQTVLDPILAAGGGEELSSTAIRQALCRELLPLTALLTPNTVEARRLSGKKNLSDAVKYLLKQGCGAVLLTGAHENTDEVLNTLYYQGKQESLGWPRLPGQYHGSGCTLASAVSAGLAKGLSLPQAVREGQEYTWQALRDALPVGGGQWIPKRLPDFPAQ